jgi:hypothetical protein
MPLLCKLDNLKENNPGKYWTLLNDLSRDKRTISPDIANITWFNYFQELNYNKLNAPNFDIKKELKRLEEEQMFSELDFKITDKKEMNQTTRVVFFYSKSYCFLFSLDSLF